MGRHLKRKRSTKAAESKGRDRISKENEEKIKQSILEVFCKQTVPSDHPTEAKAVKHHSPKGYQLKHLLDIDVIAQQRPFQKRKFGGLKASKRSRHADVSSSSSDGMTESSRRRSKTISSTKRQKVPRNTSSKKQTEKETAVDRHVKVAHGFAYLHALENNCPKERNMTAICPGRITRKYELLQTGKKSAPAKRGFTEPQTSSSPVDVEIKKLLASNKPSVRTATVTNADAQTSDVDMMESDEDNSYVSEPKLSCRTISPLKLDVRETIRGIMAKSEIKSSRKLLFPDRDLLQEVTSSLQKLLVQNAPKEITPTSFPLKDRSRASGSIQRNLTESFLSCQEGLQDSVRDAGRDNHESLQDGPIIEVEKKMQLRSDISSTVGHGQTEIGNYENSLPFEDMSHRNGLDFYQQKDRELHAKQIGKIHSVSGSSSAPKSYRISRAPLQSRHETRKLHPERTAQCASFPQKPEDRFNFYTERDLNDQGIGNMRRQPEGTDNLQLLYNTAKYLEQEYCMLDKDRSRLKDDVAKSYRANVQDVRDKHGDVFESFFSEARGDGCEVFHQQVQERATKNVQVPRLDSPALDAVSLLKANEQLSSVESMEVEQLPSEAIQMLRENEWLTTIRSVDSQRPGDILRPSSEPRGILDTGDSRDNSQCSECGRLTHQMQMQQRDIEPMPSIHSYVAPKQLTWLCNRHRHTRSAEALDFLDYVDHDQSVRYASDRPYPCHQMLVSPSRRSNSSQERHLAVTSPFIQVPRPSYSDKHSPWGQLSGPSIQQNSSILGFQPLQRQTSGRHSHFHNDRERTLRDKHCSCQQNVPSAVQQTWDNKLGHKPVQHPQNFSPPTPDMFSRPQFF